MEKLEFKIITDLSEAKKIWNELTPDETIYDNWDFRHCFYKFFNYPLRFYAGYLNGELIGLLPLQYNSDEKWLEFFAEDFMEDNRVFLKTEFEHYLPSFFEQIEKRARIFYIRGEDDFTKNLPIEEYKYILNLDGLKNRNDFINRNFQSRALKNMKREISVIEKNKIEVIENSENDLELLFELNKKIFGEESTFNILYWEETFRDIFKNFNAHLLSIAVNGEKLAVSFSILYKNIYYFYSVASDNKKIPNLGKYLVLKNIDKAIELGAKIIDTGIGDGWKERWHLDKIPQYKFKRD
ncbi:GNAT family N-acetyltransferase [Candidatus Falkowbacteria bacterium]|nr:GNAT family N-acetyltransferase [Candidatus Falkowbacteria bacterium]